MADIFVSSTSNDRDWALWIAAELKALGHTPVAPVEVRHKTARCCNARSSGNFARACRASW
jgi:hypothetical protein